MKVASQECGVSAGIATDPKGAVHRRFEQQVQRRPEAVALIADGSQLTYRQLNERANRLARYLLACGVTHENLVGVCLRRSPETVVAILAILKAGGAYVPLDPDYPRERIAFMLEDTRAAVIVTDESCAQVLPSTDAKVVLIDTAAAAIAAEDSGNLGGPNSARDLIYVMYTSGSTGRPKGVMIEHRSVMRLVCGADYVLFDPSQRFLLLAPITFDASTFELWGPLLNGGSLAIAPAATPSLDGIGELIARLGVTTLWLTAGLFHLMIEQNAEGLRPLRQLVAGGDALSVASCRRALAALPGCILVNGYGPTETTTFAVCMQLRAEALNEKSVPIGFPINETQVFILDDQFEPVARGEAGELCIGGAGVARGYLNDEARTREKFITPRWAEEPAMRLYRSGDRVRYRADGAIEFLGRFDEQVKIAGYRVEPNEVAAVLREHPEVREAAVVVARAPGESAQLIAYTAGAAGAAPDRDRLREYLATKLPAYMRPAQIVVLDAIPLTSNGKLDRAALLTTAPVAAPMNAAATTPLPDTIEASIATIWREVLRRDEISVTTNFFDLGGDSLRLIEVHARMRKQLGSKLPITDLFKYPTIAAIAERLRSAGEAAPVTDDVASRARRQKELLMRRGGARA